jgi:hypothetical protein
MLIMTARVGTTTNGIVAPFGGITIRSVVAGEGKDSFLRVT